MELFRTLGQLIEPPGPGMQRLAELLDLGPLPERSAHADLFLLQLFPLASVYLGEDGKMGGRARDRIAGFWRALEIPPPDDSDHLTVLLASYARLAELEAAAVDELQRRWRHARRAFLWEHLLSWLPIFVDKLRDLDPPFYWAWADLLARALVDEAAELPLMPELPLHLRQAPEMSDPRRESGEAFLQALLTPVRSGFVLVRTDLERAGRRLRLGVRAGERRLVLQALLGQDSEATLSWLAQEAARWARGHRAWEPATGSVAAFWAARADATAALLTELAQEL